ncbi:MAG TPA: hypothetical protein VF789_10650 [Thermoanaerobaculia bacterium]
MYLLLTGEWHQASVENTRLLPMDMPAGSQLSEIWFSSKGTLFSTFVTKENKLNIASWDPNGRPNQLKTVIFPEGPVLVNSFHGGLPFNNRKVQLEILPYAVSNDGASIAWIWEGKLFWGAVEKASQIKGKSFMPDIPLSAVSAVAVVRPGLVLALDEDASRLLSFTVGKEVVSFPFRRGEGPRSIWGRSNFRVLTSTGRGKPFLLSVLDRELIAAPRISREACVAVSTHGKTASGTEDGLVIFPTPSGPSQFNVMGRVGKIRTLAFWDEDMVVGSGEWGGLFLVEQGSHVSLLAPTSTGVQFLAVAKKRIAYATPGRIVVGNVGYRIGFSEAAKWLLAITFSLVSLLSFIRAIAIDLSPFLLRRKGKRKAIKAGIKDDPERAEDEALESDSAPDA